MYILYFNNKNWLILGKHTCTKTFVEKLALYLNIAIKKWIFEIYVYTALRVKVYRFSP